MINIRTLRKIKNNGGLTLRNGKPVTYKTGYQVATEGIETTDIRKAMDTIKEYGGNAGVWYSDGVWYIDRSHRESTKHKALEVGKAHNQISILQWNNMNLIYC